MSWLKKLTVADIERHNQRIRVGGVVAKVRGDATVAKRIRQGEKPPNKLESDWRLHLVTLHPDIKFRDQAIRFRLANGAWYKPDLMAWMNCRMVCWETKGPKQAKNVARGILTIKVAAALWPEVLFILVWKENGEWKQQEVLP